MSLYLNPLCQILAGNKSVSLATLWCAAYLNLISDNRRKGLTDLFVCQRFLFNSQTIGKSRGDSGIIRDLFFFPKSELHSQDLDLCLLALLLYNTELTDSTGSTLVKTKNQILFYHSGQQTLNQLIHLSLKLTE